MWRLLAWAWAGFHRLLAGLGRHGTLCGADGRSRPVPFRDGERRHGYDVNPRPRRIVEFAGVVVDSFAPSATLVNRAAFAGVNVPPGPWG